MKRLLWQKGISRRRFLRNSLISVSYILLHPLNRSLTEASSINPLFWIKDIHNQPFYLGSDLNYHVGVDSLLDVMGNHGLKFYRSSQETTLSSLTGMIASNDIVLIKVNAQWKYRGCTNSDLIRG